MPANILRSVPRADLVCVHPCAVMGDNEPFPGYFAGAGSGWWQGRRLGR
jgi:hypothetical protein